MTGARAVRRSGGVVIAMLLAAGLAPARMAAAEQSSRALPGVTVAAITVDLDGDGSAELLRLRDRQAPGFDLEAWMPSPDGWSVAATGELVPPEPGSEESAPFGEVGALLPWMHAGRERALAVTAVFESAVDAPPSLCCVALAEVRAVGGALELRPLESDAAPAESMQTADLDADGTDELVTTAVTYESVTDPGTIELSVYGWNGSGFERTFHIADDDLAPGLPWIGESDGVPGDEIFLGPTTLGRIERLMLRDGEVRRESAHLDLGERFSGWVVGAANGAILVQAPEGVRVLRWPQDGEAVEVGRISSLTFPSIAVVGTGSDALIVTHDGFDFAGETRPVTTVHDLALHPLGEVPAAATDAALWELMRDSMTGRIALERPLFPYVGPFPGGLDGEPAYLASGMLIQPGGTDGFEARPVASLLGVAPIGRLGPGGSWMALGDWQLASPSGGMYLSPFSGQPASGRLSLVPMTELLRADDEMVHASIEARGAFEITRDAETVTLMAPPDGFEAVITAPEGSFVIVSDGIHSVVGELGAEPFVLEVEPRSTGREGRNQGFERLVVVLTPDGRGALHRWEGEFVREAPELTSSAESHAFSLQATVMGRVSPGSAVSVDGEPIALNKFGAFRAEVGAPPWPRDVVVVARDPLGNETATRLQVVGVLDYRGLPWLPIFGVGTLAAGAFLFVRTPGRRAEPGVSWGDATLEDIEGD